MRVLVFSQHFWPEVFRINEVARELRAAGAEVTAFTGKPNYPEGQVFPGYRVGGVQTEWHEGLEIVRVPLSPRGVGGAKRLVANYLSFIASSALLGPWALRGRRFDAVFVYGTSPILQAIGAWVIARLKGAALVLWVQDLWPDSLEMTGYVRHPRLLAAVAAVVRWIYRRADLILVQSQAFEAPVRAMAGVTPVVYHPNPGDADVPALQAAPDLGAGFKLLFAGNLGTVQALETVLDAAELAGPDIRWVLVGSGARSAWLASEVQRRGLTQVELPGRFPPAAMPGFFAQADGLLVSLVRGEAMSQVVPSKIQAYLAAGRPILAAMDGEGARVVIEAGAGLACPAEDAAALATAARRLQAMSAQERAALGATGRRYFEAHFEPRRLARVLLGHLESAVALRRGGSAGEKRTSE